MRTTLRLSVAALLLAAVSGVSRADDLTASLRSGTPDLQSAGPLSFGPDGVLFVADTQGAAIFAIDTGDRPSAAAVAPIKVEGIDAKVAAVLGTSPQEILIKDVVVNPASGKAYLAVARGRGPDAAPVIVRINSKGDLEVLALKDVKFAKAVLPNAATGRGRAESITDLAYLAGNVYIAGLANEQFASTLRSIPFPFREANTGTGVEIFHGAHGRFETAAPVRTFVTYEIKGEPYLLAAYTCTPLVKFAVADLKPGVRVKGTTVAELGNRNKPLDMVVYKRDGKNFLLLANSSRGVMKIDPGNVANQEGIVKPVKDKAGLTYDTITALKGVEQLDKLDDEHALVLMRGEGGRLDLATIAMP